MTVALHLLDTDTASYLIKCRTPAIEARLAAIPPDRVCISVITKAELLYGLKRVPASHRLHAAVGQFLKVVRIPPWDEDAADHYVAIRHLLTVAGTPIGELDMMIAAHALAIGAILVTSNTRHFRRIAAPLALANWHE